MLQIHEGPCMVHPDTDATSNEPSDAPPRPRTHRRGRWARRLLATVLVLFLVAAAVHWWWGRNAASRLEAQIAAARAAGEPVTVEELNRWSGARGGTGENIVPAI